MGSGDAGLSVTIANPGWRNPVVVPISGPSASWEVSTPGRFSAHISSKRAHSLGFGDLKSKWLRWDHPTMGAFGGQIRRNPTDSTSGTMELSVDSFHVRMKGIRTPTSMKTASGSPGQLAMQLLTLSATDKRLWFDSIVASSSGPVLRIDLRGDDLFDVISSLANDNDYEFGVTVNDDGTIDWTFHHRIGTDKTGSVILAEGLNVISCQIAPTIDPMVNDILAASGEDDWGDSPKKVVTDPDSILTYERQATTRQYMGLPGIASLTVRANLDLALDSLPAMPAVVTVNENDPVNRNIREGDTVRLWSASQNGQYFFRIRSRSVDGGVAKYAGDCIDEDVEV